MSCAQSRDIAMRTGETCGRAGAALGRCILICCGLRQAAPQETGSFPAAIRRGVVSTRLSCPALQFSAVIFRKRRRMANERAKPAEIVSKLRQVEVLMGQGMSRLDAIRKIGVVEQTYYRWRKQYGGMGVDQLKELKRLQLENERLRKAVSELTLDKLILAEAARGNF